MRGLGCPAAPSPRQSPMAPMVPMPTAAPDPSWTFESGPPRSGVEGEAAKTLTVTGWAASRPCRTLEVAAHPTQERTSGRSALLAVQGREQLQLVAGHPRLNLVTRGRARRKDAH